MDKTQYQRPDTQNLNPFRLSPYTFYLVLDDAQLALEPASKTGSAFLAWGSMPPSSVPNPALKPLQ
jgi:hypothetical protein